MKLKKSLTLILTALLAVCIGFSAETTEKYTEFLNQAKKYEEQKKYVYALASYLDALKENTNTAEAFDGYKKISDAFNQGIPGLDRYDEFTKNDAWVELCKEYETYWNEHPGDIADIYYYMAFSTVNMEKRVGIFRICPVVIESFKFYEMRKPIINGWAGARNKTVTDIPYNWPIDSYLKGSEYNTVKTIDARKTVDKTFNKKGVAHGTYPYVIYGNRADDFNVAINHINLKIGETKSVETPYWNALTPNTNVLFKKDYKAPSIRPVVDFEISDKAGSYKTTVSCNVNQSYEFFEPGIERSSTCQLSSTHNNWKHLAEYGSFEVPANLVEDFKAGKVSVSVKTMTYASYNITETVEEATDYMGLMDSSETVKERKSIVIKAPKCHGTENRNGTIERPDYYYIGNKNEAIVNFINEFPVDKSEYIKLSREKIYGFTIPNRIFIDYEGWLSYHGVRLPIDEVMTYYPEGFKYDRDFRRIYRNLTDEETAKFQYEEKVETFEKKIYAPAPDYKVTRTKIGAYPVNQKLFEEVMGYNPSINKCDFYAVENISFYEVMIFCNKLSMIQNLTPVYEINKSTNPDDWGKVPQGKDKIWIKYKINTKADGYRLSEDEIYTTSDGNLDLTSAKRNGYDLYRAGTKFEMIQGKKLSVINTDSNIVQIQPYEKQPEATFRVSR